METLDYSCSGGGIGKPITYLQTDPARLGDVDRVKHLEGRLRGLQRDLEAIYMPALQRLEDAGYPGAETSNGDALGHLLAGLEYELDDLTGFLFADGDEDIWTYWADGRAFGDVTVEPEKVARVSEARLIAELKDAVRDWKGELARYRAGERKARDRSEQAARSHNGRAKVPA